jgi:hypothetical protein
MGLVRALADQDITFIGFETIQCVRSDAPAHAMPDDSHAGKVLDLTGDHGAGGIPWERRTFTQ